MPREETAKWEASGHQMAAEGCAAGAPSPSRKGWMEAAQAVAEEEPKLEPASQPGKPEPKLHGAEGSSLC